MTFSNAIDGLFLIALPRLTASNGIHRRGFFHLSRTQIRKQYNDKYYKKCAHQINPVSMRISQYHIFTDGLQEHGTEWNTDEKANPRSHHRQHEIFPDVQAANADVRNSDCLHNTDFPILLHNGEGYGKP